MHVDLCKENIKEGNITKSTSFFSAKQKDLLFVAAQSLPLFLQSGTPISDSVGCILVPACPSPTSTGGTVSSALCLWPACWSPAEAVSRFGVSVPWNGTTWRLECRLWSQDPGLPQNKGACLHFKVGRRMKAHALSVPHVWLSTGCQS